MKALHLALFLGVSPLVAAAQDVSTLTYACDRGVEVPATYVVGPDVSLVVLHVDGRQVTLREEPSASGARYSWPSDGSVYVWWTKEKAATLFWKTPEGETQILTCTVL